MKSGCISLIALALLLGCGGSTPAANEPASDVVVRLRVRDDLAPLGSEGTAEPAQTPAVCDATGPEGLQVVDVAAGMNHMCAALSDGSVRCWGDGTNAVLGNGEHGRAATPVIAEGLSDIRQVEGGRMHHCGITGGGEVYCWGDNSWGQYGSGRRHTHGRVVPVRIPTLRRVEELALGADHGCARLSNGRVFCWGKNHVGQLGDRGRTDLRLSPTAVRGLRASAIAAGWNSTCAIDLGGDVLCWGEINSSARPQKVEGINEPTVQVAVGERYACARGASGMVYCLGEGADGQLGSAAHSYSESAVPVQGIPAIQSIHAGAAIACALTNEGQLWCWGASRRFRQEPGVHVVGEIAPATSVAIASVGACATVSGGGLCCFGSNGHGLLGTAWHPFAIPARPTPTPVALEW